jgi:hypothetical protein
LGMKCGVFSAEVEGGGIFRRRNFQKGREFSVGSFQEFSEVRRRSLGMKKAEKFEGGEAGVVVRSAEKCG